MGREEQVVLKLRQLVGAEQNLVPHHQWRLNLGVAMLGRVQIQHELAERAIEPRKLALQHGEAAARKFCGAFEIHHAERFADLEMLPWPSSGAPEPCRPCAA